MIEASTLGAMPVPDEVAVVGVDDDQLLCELSNPPLSSVMLNAEQGGYQAAELLDALMSRKVKRQQHLLVEPLWVVTRRSTEAVAVDDVMVAAALRFIRAKAREPIGVAQVVAQAGLSRRHARGSLPPLPGVLDPQGDSAGAADVGQATAAGKLKSLIGQDRRGFRL